MVTFGQTSYQRQTYPSQIMTKFCENHGRCDPTSEPTIRPEHLFASHNAVLTRNLSVPGNKTRGDSTEVKYHGKTRLSLGP